MNKKAITIVELLAVLVLMALVSTLIGLLISNYQNNQETISEESKANIEANLLIRDLSNDLDAFKADQYDVCSQADCVILINTFDYNYTGSEIILDVYNPQDESTLIFENQSISFGQDTYEVEGFEMSEDSSISYMVENNHLIININFILIGNQDNYTYTMTYDFLIQDVPSV